MQFYRTAAPNARAPRREQQRFRERCNVYIRRSEGYNVQYDDNECTWTTSTYFYHAEYALIRGQWMLIVERTYRYRTFNINNWMRIIYSRLFN